MRVSVRLRCTAAALVMAGAALPCSAVAQSKPQVELERRDFAEWLRTAPASPLRAVVVMPIGPGLSLGPPSTDLPLAGAPAGRIAERDGRVTVTLPDITLVLARGRVSLLSGWSLVANGPPGRATVTVYRSGPGKPKEPLYYPYDPAAVFVVSLTPAPVAGTQRLLTPDGVEVDAGDAGTVTLTIGGTESTLQVKRLPGATEDESELEIYFRDATADQGSYPAGRFVSLIPRPDGRYTLDFNRARNPFCAYNSVYPCPAPWRGNLLSRPVKAGERYAGGGLDTPPP